MNDLFDALRQAVHDYINVDQLPIRKQGKVKESYSRFQYDWDTVDGLIETDTENSEDAS